MRDRPIGTQIELFKPPRRVPQVPAEVRQKMIRLLARLLQQRMARHYGTWMPRRRIMSDKIRPQHLERKAILYIRQSSAYQVTHNLESQKLQYAMQEWLRQLGWWEIEVVDEDLGRSAAGGGTHWIRTHGFRSMSGEGRCRCCRFARNSRGWQRLVEVCRVVDTILID
jgi:hypothetical protein